MNGLLMIFLLFLLKFVYISIKIITMIVEIIFKLYAIFIAVLGLSAKPLME